MIRRNKTLTLSIAMVVSLTMLGGITEVNAANNNKVVVESSEESEAYAISVSEEEYSMPKQVNVHMGDNPSTQVNFTYTTISSGLETKVVLNKVGDNEKITVMGENSQGNADKYFHEISVSNLEPDTQYEYVVGTGEDTYSGKFKTAPASGSKEAIKFVYIADTQVANATDAKALGATLAEVNKTQDLDFVYLAGDTTDTAANETQWELLFNNGGAFPTGGEDMFGNNLVSVVQGNHDNT